MKTDKNDTAVGDLHGLGLECSVLQHVSSH